LVLVVDIDRIGTRTIARKRPGLPGAVSGISHRHMPAVPFADPDPALGVRPDAPRALIGCRRFDDGCVARCIVDLSDIAAGERGVPDVALGRYCDAIGPDAFRRLEHRHIAGLRVEPAIETGLAGEPINAPFTE